MITFWNSVIRDLLNKKFVTSVNLICIAIGLTCSALVFLYVKNESEADKFFPAYGNIYQVETTWGNSLSLKQAEILRNNLSEIAHLTLYESSWAHQNIISHNQSNFYLNNIVYADTAFFEVFQYKVLYGNLSKALSTPNSMVLTQSEAKKIFGDTNPVNKTVKLKASRFGAFDYTITAVIQDIPNNSSFQFNAVLPLSGLMQLEWYKNNAEDWGTCNYSAFAMVSKNTDLRILTEKAESVIIEHSPEWVHSIVPVKFNPLRELHFSDTENDGVFSTNNKYTVFLLGAIGLLILLVALVNYFNLSMAKVNENVRKWSIKRIIGASKMQIMKHSFASTFLLFLVATFLSVILMLVLLPFFNQYTQSSFSLHNLFSKTNIFFLIGLFLLVLLFFGLFPALLTGNLAVHSSSKPNTSTNQLNRYGLVILQFSISTILIICSAIIYKQNDYMMNHDDGYTKQNIIYTILNPDTKQRHEYLEQEFEKISNVNEVAFGNGLFGSIGASWGRKLYYQGNDKDIEFEIVHVSPDFLKLFDLKIIKGEGFGTNSMRKKDLIVNQALTRKYEITSILGASLQKDRKSENIVGVVKDFNYNNLHNHIGSLALECSDNSNRMMFVRLNSNSPAEIKQTLDSFNEIWNTVSPNYPFNYEFIEKNYKKTYETELKLMNLILVASLLSILMGAMGLIGLVYFIITRRTKEIGVRKVNGAKASEILMMLNSNFAQWVVIAFILATPIAYYTMVKWLENFAYKTEISWWIFVLAGAIVLVIALFTVSWQSWRAASRNPVEALRYE